LRQSFDHADWRFEVTTVPRPGVHRARRLSARQPQRTQLQERRVAGAGLGGELAADRHVGCGSFRSAHSSPPKPACSDRPSRRLIRRLPSERRQTSPALRLPLPSPSSSSRSAADAPGLSKHRAAPRGGRRCRCNASPQRTGTPTVSGRLPGDPGGGREIGHCPWLASGRFRDVTGTSVAHLIGGHPAAGSPWSPRWTSLRFRLLPAPEVPGNRCQPKGTPRKYQDGLSSWRR
jgi:hypothetical protein